MAVRITQELCLKEMVAHSLPYWTVKDGGKVVALHQSTSDVEESKLVLQSLLESFQGDFCTVVLSNKSNEEKGKGAPKAAITREFNVVLNGSVSGIGGGGGNMNLLQQIQDLRIQMFTTTHNQAITDLRREFEESKGDGGIGSLIQELKPYLPQLLGMKGNTIPAAQSLSGPTEDAAIIKINELLQRWANVDAGYLTAMEKLVKVAETKPETYAMAKTYLNSAM